ncbi:MAG: c-type cytochrome [Deltaproteobacteria bacterium]|nr:c-type cytochrome [Deltaproteobacteria bacterium]
MSRWFYWLLPVVIVISTSHAVAQTAPAAELFASKCSVCHGVNGDGKGTAAYLLSPKPRDFTQGVYKFKSTSIGSLPTDQDLLRVLKAGIPGTSMPNWDMLTDAELKGLLQHVKSFSTRFQEEEPGEPIAIGPQPPVDQESLERGKKLYKVNACDTCHGVSGRGDGQSAMGLKGDDGYPARPRNFSFGDRIRGGKQPADIYRAIMVGLEGTPMAGYGLSERDTWDLVHYVQSLAIKPAHLVRPGDGLVPVNGISGEVPVDPADPVWHLAPGVPVPVRPLWERDRAPDYVIVRGLTNGREIGFLVEWPDELADRSVLRTEDFRDSVALQFPVLPVSADSSAPFYGMGEKSKLVNIWHWRADWQQDAARFGDIASQYSGNAIDQYPREATEQKVFLTGWAANNPMASRTRRSPVEDLNSAGQGSLTSQMESDQDVEGRGIWADGKWRVVFRRRLRTAGAGDVQFTREAADALRIAVAVWDGREGDRNGQKLVSGWHSFNLESPDALKGAPSGKNGSGCGMGVAADSGTVLLLVALVPAFVIRRRWARSRARRGVSCWE